MSERSRVVALVVSLVLIVVLNLAVTGWLVDRSARRFCDTVGASVHGYRDAPPASEVGRTQQRNLEKLYRDLGCE